MKNLKFILLTFFFLTFGISSASATPILYDWYIYVNGTFYQEYPNFFQPPKPGGEITNVSGFDRVVGNYGDPEAQGSVEITFVPDAAGTYYIQGYFNIDILGVDHTNHVFNYNYKNESGTVHGTATGGVYGGVAGVYGKDIALYMGWNVDLDAGKEIILNFLISSEEPSGFYLSQMDYLSREEVFLSSTVAPESSTVVPEPTTLLLLGSGLTGLIGLGRRKFRR